MKINTKYSLLVLLMIDIGSAQAVSILSANTTYNMYIRAGTTSCLQASVDCRLNPGSSFTDNDRSVVDSAGNTYGSSIGGDGWAGIIQFTTDASGENYIVGSFNMDMREAGPPDYLVTWADDPGQMTGTIDASGNMTFIPVTRMALSGVFVEALGVQPLNIDDSLHNLTPTNDWTPLTTGTSSITAGQIDTNPLFETSITGSALTSDGAGGWNGELVSAFVMGDSWQFFSATPFTEVWDIHVAAAPSAVPVPAAVWLFGSGLVGLAGVARRRKTG